MADDRIDFSGIEKPQVHHRHMQGTALEGVARRQQLDIAGGDVKTFGHAQYDVVGRQRTEARGQLANMRPKHRRLCFANVLAQHRHGGWFEHVQHDPQLLGHLPH
ncbi:hypothetical protein D3C72_1723090 [compost metagenome]